MTLFVIRPCPNSSYCQTISGQLEVTVGGRSSTVQIGETPSDVVEVAAGDSCSMEIHNILESVSSLRSRGIAVEIVILGAWQKLADALREERFQFTLVH